MDSIILDDLEFKPDSDQLVKKMHLKEGRPETERFRELIADAQHAARPKAFYKVSKIQSRGESSVAIDGEDLESRVFRVNTDEVNRVFPFVVTCGTELTEWADGFADMLDKLFADELKMAALRSAMAQLEKDVESRFSTGGLSQMNPGSLEDWSIYEQKKLFAILGDRVSGVGVKLLSSMVMFPDKTESGIFFEKEKTFTSCQLCPVEKCPSRKTPYDSGLYDREYLDPA